MITVEITITNEFGQQYGDVWKGKVDTVRNNEWDEITNGLIDEALSTKEF